jgi:hypothetical protein
MDVYFSIANFFCYIGLIDLIRDGSINPIIHRLMLLNLFFSVMACMVVYILIKSKGKNAEISLETIHHLFIPAIILICTIVGILPFPW